MKNNKIVIYIGILAIGLFLGWFLFGNSSSKETEHNHEATAETNQMWTCSMHPQIMQPEAGDCPICGMDLIPAESSADGLMADQFKLTENAMALANIQTSIVGNGKTEDSTVKLSGKIVENEEANAVQVSYFSGRIERLNVSFTGEEVRKGQLLATIYSPELYAAQQELITASSLKESQPALYKAVRNKLKLWKLSENQINQIETSGKVKENFPVYATVSGTVSEKLVEQGDYIKQGQPLLKIANLSTVWASFDVYENQIDVFKKGQEISVTTNAYANKEFKAKVDFIDPVLDTRTRTVKLRAVLNNKQDVFKPGMFVEGKVKGMTSSKEQVLTIPSTAVLWTGERSVVYLKTSPDQAIFEMREIVLGNQIGNNYEVLDGLSNGDEIVTNGTFTVDAAAQLQGKKSMMNQSKKEESMVSMEHMEMKFPESFQKEFRIILKMYLNMKDAFVQNDTNKVSDFAKTMYSKTKTIDASGLANMETTHFNKTKEMIMAISENSDIEKQRSHFVILNENIIAMATNINDLDTTLYVQKCPMANNNKGAIWLSAEKEIRNPYYGDAMLTCGEVKQVIEK
ncbi:efflux RND transporter periplasmic adaptor subunit [Olleya marilimosa]|uniref:efflux RND transporter periplasmic adaptor subunit n=1 Tax=Olleya marilimosa TaxID=272164 RepID=UPI000480AD99|nr:efflux RND transporter periplasmic adaptor subunit [Olleya marilimosa]